MGERLGQTVEGRYFNNPFYKRNGLIPGWSEVVAGFKLDRFAPRDFRLLRVYYRAQRRIAEGRPKKAARIFGALDRIPEFRDLEGRDGPLLSEIAFFVRGPSERRKGR